VKIQTHADSLETQHNHRFKSGWTKILLSCIVLALVALNVSKASAISTSAQMCAGIYAIIQNGIRVGEIYVPERNPKATQYVEHWVLYNSYVYPSPDQSHLKTEIRVEKQIGYESEADFFARVSWVPGYRYVRVDCTEFDKLPTR